MLHLLSLSAVVFGFWLLLSGHYEPLIIGFGVVSTAFVAYVVHRMEVVDHEGHPVHLGWRWAVYWPWLGWEIIKANVAVARIILDPKMPIEPGLMTVKCGQESELGTVIYANSITLTPGTVTVDEVEGDLEVHALTRAARQGLETGEMNKRVCWFETGKWPD